MIATAPKPTFVGKTAVEDLHVGRMIVAAMYLHVAGVAEDAVLVVVAEAVAAPVLAVGEAWLLAERLQQ